MRHSQGIPLCIPQLHADLPSEERHRHAYGLNWRMKAKKLKEAKELLTNVVDMSRGDSVANLFIGAHVSASGGPHTTIPRIKSIGGNAFALFLKNQRQWSAAALKSEDVEKFKKLMAECSLDRYHIIPHGSYLINLGSPDPNTFEKGFESFLDDLQRCHKLGIPFYNIHPGSTVGKCSAAESIGKIASAINDAHNVVPEVCILLETMAGQGNTIGSTFEELHLIIDKIKDKSRVGVCLDTCHIFAAGYDIRTRKSYETTMANFDKILGFKYLKAVHLNDSKTELGSGKDRHENIGKGQIGLDAFKFLVNDPRFRNVPLILETPEDAQSGLGNYAHEIQLLYSLALKPNDGSS